MNTSIISAWEWVRSLLCRLKMTPRLRLPLYTFIQLKCTFPVVTHAFNSTCASVERGNASLLMQICKKCVQLRSSMSNSLYLGLILVIISGLVLFFFQLPSCFRGLVFGGFFVPFSLIFPSSHCKMKIFSGAVILFGETNKSISGSSII